MCETFGHDLEPGAAITEEEYRAQDPGGRAVLKGADYIAPLEEPDKEYPFWLTTGRLVYHFHTRTKTGRCPELQQAAPEAFVQLATEDAKRLGIQEGDEVEVASRRGTVARRRRSAPSCRGMCSFLSTTATGTAKTRNTRVRPTN